LIVSELLDRFIRYAKVDTQSDEAAESYPTTAKQKDLGKMLAGELLEMGLKDAKMDKWGIVTATIPASDGVNAPVMALLAHVDTSPEASGAEVKPVLHKNYDGKDIVLPGDKSKVIRVSETEGLAECKGKTVITSDGTTLLGADDKAGVAVIMSAAAKLMADKSIPHGKIRICFTCDEETGRGTEHVDVKALGADVAYTLDGEGQGCIENETFSADQATVTVTGYNIHPGLANGKMVNAIRLASEFVARMPWQALSPETTCQRQPFLHPYVYEGGVAEAKIRILLRSFDSADLPKQADLLRQIAATIEAEHPKAKIDVAIKRQYRNMIEGLAKEPRAVALAEQAVRTCGMEPKFESIRGGTDGARLTEMGLPTPNLSTGMHNFHSPLEWACLEEMEKAVEVVVELAKLWGQEKA
jgi:tripeptide aminopeptidase